MVIRIELENFTHQRLGNERIYKAIGKIENIYFELQITEWYLNTGTKYKVELTPRPNLLNKIFSFGNLPVLPKEEWYRLYFQQYNNQAS